MAIGTDILHCYCEQAMTRVRLTVASMSPRYESSYSKEG